MKREAALARRLPFFYGWVIVLATGSAMFARNSASNAVLGIFILPMSQELGWSRTLFSGAVSLGGLCASLALPPTGWLADRYGSRAMLTVSILILGGATVFLGWATAPIAFYLAFITGRVMFAGPIQLGGTVAVSNWFIRRRGRAIATLLMMASAGNATFVVLAQLFINVWSWHTSWLLLGVVVWSLALLPNALLVFRRPEDVGLEPDGEVPRPEDPQAPLQTEPQWALRQALRTPALWLLALAGGMVFMVQSGVNLHQAAYLQSRGLSGAVAAGALAVMNLSAAPAALAWGFLAERINIRYLYSAVALIMTVALALLLTTETPIQAFLFDILFGISIGGILTLPLVAYADYYGRRSLGAIRGVTGAFLTLGQASGAIVAGVVFDATGSYRSVFGAFLLMTLLAAVFVALARQPRPAEAAPS